MFKEGGKIIVGREKSGRKGVKGNGWTVVIKENIWWEMHKMEG